MKRFISIAAASLAFAAGAVEWKNLDPEHRLGGRKASSGYLQGKVVLVNRWDAKSAPCRALLPKIEEIWRSFKTKPLVVLGGHVSGACDSNEVAKAVAESKLSYSIYEGAGLAAGEPAFNTVPFLYVVDETGKVIYRGRSEQTATQAIVQALTDMESPKDLKQWMRFLDYELEHLPAHAYLRAQAFRKRFPKEARDYTVKFRQLVAVPNVKETSELVAFAKRAKDAPKFGPNEKAKERKYQALVNGIFDKYAPLKEASDPRVAQEAKNALADLAWIRAAF